MRTLVRIGLAAVLWAGLVALARPTVAQEPEKKQPAAGTVKSRIKVTLPQDDAELLIEDKPTKATGKSREFETPPIDGRQVRTSTSSPPSGGRTTTRSSPATRRSRSRPATRWPWT